MTAGNLELEAVLATFGADFCPEGWRPVGRVEAAELLDVSPAAIDKWIERGVGFPEPIARIGGRTPVWPAGAVIAFGALRVDGRTARHRTKEAGS